MKVFHRRHIRHNLFLLILLGIVLTLLLNYLIPRIVGRTSEDHDEVHQVPTYEFPNLMDFAKTLKQTASEDNVVMMALVDSGFIQMAYNFYVSSVLKHDISNFMFVALDNNACVKVRSAFPGHHLRCFVFKEMQGADHPSMYYSREFKEKIYVRRFIVLEAIKLGHTVLFTDLDVILFQNPLIDIKKTCHKENCDLATQWDDHLDTHNAGFIYVRPTKYAIKFYHRLAKYELSHGVGQLALNAALREIKRKKSLPFTVTALSSDKYRIGYAFFEHNICPEPKSYKGIIMLHNNYIIEEHNKIFRFKECMLWDWDSFDGYYSNVHRNYIYVDGWLPHGYPEHQSLLNIFAIGKLLGRTVILPHFTCNSKKCNLLQRMYGHTHLHFINRFDNATGQVYRESTFLNNPRVPDKIKTSLSPMYHISFHDEEERKNYHGEEVVTMKPRDHTNGPTARELLAWFGEKTEKILRFDNLYGMFVHLKYTDHLGEPLVRVIRQL